MERSVESQVSYITKSAKLLAEQWATDEDVILGIQTGDAALIHQALGDNAAIAREQLGIDLVWVTRLTDRTPEGKTPILACPSNPLFDGNDQLSYDSTNEAMDGGRSVVSWEVNDEDGKLQITTPIRDGDGTVIGAIVVGQQTYSRMLNQIALSSETGMTLFIATGQDDFYLMSDVQNDEIGNRLFFDSHEKRRDQSLNLQQLAEHNDVYHTLLPILQEVQRSGQAAMRTITLDGVPYASYFTPQFDYKGEIRSVLLSRIPGYVATEQEIMQKTESLVWMSYTFFLILSIFGMIAAFFAARRITRPLQTIASLVKRIAGGDLSTTIAVHRSDEVGSLAKDINKMTDNLQSLLTDVSYKGSHDLLTGLYNRSEMNEYIEAAIKQRKKNERLALINIDLDQFKLINDVFDHIVGDELLREVAGRITQIVDNQGKIARSDGDEFIVMIRHVKSVEHLETMAFTLLSVIAEPYLINGRQFMITASIGIGLYESPESGPVWLKKADTAMYIAKKQRNSYRLFESSMSQLPSREQQLERRMPVALEQGEFTVYYQPKLSLDSNTIIGAEALLRWKHPELGMISPQEFIPIAERTGFIIKLGEWVIHTVCKHLKQWDLEGLPPFSASVNLSMIQFRQRDLIQFISQCIEQNGITAERIDLELTESVFMHNPHSTIQLMRELKSIGVQMSLDDFGTGFSSLSYLKNIPVDCLKLDKSFIEHIATVEKDQAIVRSVIEIAHTLGLTVVTEGVETKEQMDILKLQNCDAIQGYVFCPPLPAGQFLAFCKESQPV
ncbi:EAL domain-containing protein [Paenibacillus abyssi]|uniref:EAL domain-containing protein n=1 Tax=Paenibacillus abyssi TaxID=1340531 RepID=UPI00360929FB